MPLQSFAERSADPIAIYTLVLAVATIALWLVTWGMLRTTKRSVDLSRSEFNATHRPRLHVRNIVVKDSSGPFQHEAFNFSPGERINGQFYVSNIGSGEARVVESHCEVLWGLKDGLPMQRPYEGKNGNNPVPRTAIPSGSSVFGLFSSEEPFTALHWDENGRSNVYVMGWVEYIDTSNVRRRTAFCRRYVERDGSRRFYPVDDPDYEHEE
ncbi:hypothetical protein [Sphingomonas sp.]|uniref:hypothetical protein n=1 Tax=Sphingomonas sp. TaxID=28214 RepID=UPI0038A3DB41